MSAMDTLKLRNDAAKRERLFDSTAMAHPAKGHISLWEEMVLRYSKEGDLVLDPMAGIGTSLVAALLGRNVICLELEPHFVEPMARSWEKMRQHPMLGHQMGQVVILRGDARCLPLPDASVGAAITSPPYEESPVADARHLHFDNNRREASIADKRAHGVPTGYTRPVDAILTSPPYEQALKGGGIAEKGHTTDPGLANRAYSRNVYEKLKGKVERGEYKGQRPDAWTSPTNLAAQGYLDGYSVTGENIGNQKGQAYWESMRQVYAECWRVLRPGGVLALVLKGFTRDGQYVDLPGQTEAMLLGAGWVKHDHWRRELWSLSFWRILQKRRDPAAFDERLNFEEVLAFKKPEGTGKGVDAVITSPPYEGSLVQEQSGVDATKLQRPHGPNSQFARPQSYTRKEGP